MSARRSSPASPGTLLIRADADPEIGAGHVMRCLALAQGWRDRGGSALLATATSRGAVARRLAEDEVEIRPLAVAAGSAADAERTVRLARESGAAWVAVDGYRFGVVHQRRLEEAGLRVLWIDDEGHAEHYCADLVLNQNPHATPDLYARRERRTRLLLGPRYALLRREFRQWRHRERRIPERARRILVSLGGGDPRNVTAEILRALPEAGGFSARVVVGALNPHLEEVRAAAESSRVPVELLHDVSDMVPLMAEADLAVAAAGSTTWELLYMGLPAILLVFAPNQEPIAREVARRGAARALGWHHEVTAAAVAAAVAELAGSPQARARLSRLGRSWVDGRGVERVLDAMERTEVTAHAHSLPGQ